MSANVCQCHHRTKLDPKTVDAVPATAFQELLQQAAAGQKWLVVLDDLWAASHEDELNFVDAAAAPDTKVFVTTRFAKLFPG